MHFTENDAVVLDKGQAEIQLVYHSGLGLRGPAATIKCQSFGAEDDMGYIVSKRTKGDGAPRDADASTPSKRKKRTSLAPNFPQEPPSSPAAEAPLFGNLERCRPKLERRKYASS